MAAGLCTGLILAVLCGADGDPRKGKGAAASAEPPATQVRTPDYRVVFWWDGRGFRSQPYDLRKGQYTKAVDDWVKRPHYDEWGFLMPGPMATIRDVFLDLESGDTDAEKLASATGRELAKLEDFDPRRYTGLRPTQNPTVRPLREIKKPEPPKASAPRVGGPPAAPFPVPFPYPRPHP